MRAYLLSLTQKFISLLPESHCYRLKAELYNLVGESIDPTARIYSSVIFATLPISIGARTHIGARCVFTGDLGCPIQVGSDCDIGPLVTFLTGTHQIGSSQRRAGKGYGLPVKVGAGSWIGAGSIILPGVTIGPGCVIAAGSVVNSDVPANTLAAGVPSVVKRLLEIETDSHHDQ